LFPLNLTRRIAANVGKLPDWLGQNKNCAAACFRFLRQPIKPNACPNSRQNRQRASLLDAKPFWVLREYRDTAEEHQQTGYLEQH